jgi:hypothetical protein
MHSFVLDTVVTRAAPKKVFRALEKRVVEVPFVPKGRVAFL